MGAKGPLLDSGAPAAAGEECGALASVIMCKLEQGVLDSTPNLNEITQSSDRPTITIPLMAE